MSLPAFRSRFLLAAAVAALSPLTAMAQPPAASDLLPKPVIKNVVPYVAVPLPLDDVRLNGGPLKDAQEADAKYLLSLDPDRMLFYLRQRANMPAKQVGYSGGPAAQQGYGGWDGGGRQLTGHISGHYLSAISYMYAATGNPEFKKRVDYIVNEYAAIQDAQKDGYLGGLMGNPPRGGAGAAGGGRNGAGGAIDGKALFEELATGTIRSGGFDLNGMWSPWYVQHKIFAGLRDAYRVTGNKQALEVEINLAKWTDGILSKLTPQQIQTMLATEFGGMNESMADLYADTGDPRWLKACDYFQHHAIVDPLAQQRDILAGKHGNTQVPKMLGELERFIFTGQKLSGDSSKFFWEAVVDHHTFATGGHGYDEYFGAADKLSGTVDGTGQRSADLRTCESCNVYNMLKYTRKLFAIDPDDKYSEYLERGLFNHVLASIDPATGATCYMVPIGQGVTHEYQQMMQSFTCCVGTGMESHALHGDGIYYEAGNKLWITLFAPSTAHWTSQGATVNVTTDFPLGDSATVNLNIDSPKLLTLAIRRPAWAGEGFSIKINGQDAPGNTLPKPGSYVELTRTWQSGDTITLNLPKTLHTEALADNHNRVALMWGPIVLAGDLGPARGAARVRQQATTFASFVADANEPMSQWLKPVPGKPGTFTGTPEGGQATTFAPFYELAEHRYSVYWDLFSPSEWAKKGNELTPAEVARAKLETATVAYAQPGQMQPERDYNFQGEGSTPTRVRDEDGRRGTKWFSFDLPVDAAGPNTLVVTYDSDEAAKRTFDILIDDKKVATQTVEKKAAPQFYDVEYKIPADFLTGKKKVTVKFQAADGSEIAGVFGLRTVRADK